VDGPASFPAIALDHWFRIPSTQEAQQFWSQLD